MKRLSIALVFISLCLSSLAYAQEGAFLNFHVSTLGGFNSTSPLERDEFGNEFVDTAFIDNGIGGGFSGGYRFNYRWTVLMNLDIIAQNGTTNSFQDISTATFIFDLGVRYGLTQNTQTQPYILANIGYYGFNFDYGDPTVYIGPGGGGYSSGVDSYDGWQLSGGLGMQFSNVVDIHLIGAWANVADFDSKFSIRLNAGVSLWLHDEALPTQ